MGGLLIRFSLEGSFSFNLLTTTMKVVLALLLILICLIQVSFGEQEDIANAASSVGNLPLQREVREAARGCKQGGKNCRGELGQEKKKNRKNRRKGSKSKTKKSMKAA